MDLLGLGHSRQIKLHKFCEEAFVVRVKRKLNKLVPERLLLGLESLLHILFALCNNLGLQTLAEHKVNMISQIFALLARQQLRCNKVHKGANLKYFQRLRLFLHKRIKATFQLHIVHSLFAGVQELEPAYALVNCRKLAGNNLVGKFEVQNAVVNNVGKTTKNRLL